jgi:hypothetical protein
MPPSMLRRRCSAVDAPQSMPPRHQNPCATTALSMRKHVAHQTCAQELKRYSPGDTAAVDDPPCAPVAVTYDAAGATSSSASGAPAPVRKHMAAASLPPDVVAAVLAHLPTGGARAHAAAACAVWWRATAGAVPKEVRALHWHVPGALHERYDQVVLWPTRRPKQVRVVCHRRDPTAVALAHALAKLLHARVVGEPFHRTRPGMTCVKLALECPLANARDVLAATGLLCENGVLLEYHSYRSPLQCWSLDKCPRAPAPCMPPPEWVRACRTEE